MTKTVHEFNAEYPWTPPSDKQLEKIAHWVETVKLACGVEDSQESLRTEEWQVYYKPRLNSGDGRQGDWLYGFQKEFMADRLSRLSEVFAQARGWPAPPPHVPAPRPEPKEPRLPKQHDPFKRKKQQQFNRLVAGHHTDEELEAMLSLHGDGHQTKRRKDNSEKRHRFPKHASDQKQYEAAGYYQEWPAGLEWLGQVGMVSQLDSVATCLETYFDQRAAPHDRQAAYKALLAWFNPRAIEMVELPSQQLKADMVEISAGVLNMLEEGEANAGVPEEWSGYYGVLLGWYQEALTLCGAYKEEPGLEEAVAH